MRFSFIVLTLAVLSPVAFGAPIPIDDPMFFGREIGSTGVSEQVIVQLNPMLVNITNFFKKLIAVENFLAGQQPVETLDIQEPQLDYGDESYSRRIQRRDMADKIRHYSGAYTAEDDGSSSQSASDYDDSEEEP
ncbi:hypothetical protein J3Q64DRAFT_1732584 [Phycomyces blakesleeanus]|uniref:Uncharacterized protein n=2 Tax=Phycomyces blakesleeanus TaxID=4837 RepID=A0A162X1R2_PHYB8|nr:hypothetical protein PHYBLDRAFT_68695 [Phycomyces blakesleeanus NRRL 1555(-)]OAD72035.1 hypothetical protein PHYBLDRAFT_68695 [Phycomyces blakesleeanus NRRL 1555(-)]|eukprot:XP_018290075.1 hypothetical protein PHYBLDRAFT_68695 [Phycomyces blakesleeanus NRRL 1555(-)]